MPVGGRRGRGHPIFMAKSSAELSTTWPARDVASGKKMSWTLKMSAEMSPYLGAQNFSLLHKKCPRTTKMPAPPSPQFLGPKTISCTHTTPPESLVNSPVAWRHNNANKVFNYRDVTSGYHQLPANMHCCPWRFKANSF